MPDEKTQTTIYTIAIGAVIGLYGLFVKHIIGHSDKQYVNGEIKALWDKKQDVTVCEKVVERIDQNHVEIKEELIEIKNLIRNGGKK